MTNYYALSGEKSIEVIIVNEESGKVFKTKNRDRVFGVANRMNKEGGFPLVTKVFIEKEQ